MKHSLIIIIWSLFVSFHDFHVTHTTIYFNADKESLEITVNVAIEDLERALEDQTAKKINIGTNTESESVDQLIEAYFRQRLTLAPNNHLIHYQWVGKEVSQDLHNLYIYFEILECNQNGAIESLLIENRIFTDILPEQSNIVLLEFGDKSHNLTFSRALKRQDLNLFN
tara:strand:+ start:2014 stop:2520 length:507 start_codon:yes stop_codon:yes gene_type:complete